MSLGRFPTTRMRRNRRDGWTRRLVAETKLTVDDLIWPVFVIEGRALTTPVDSMPGVNRVTVDRLAAHVAPAVEREGAVAVRAPQVAPGGPDQRARQASVLRLALDTRVDFGDSHGTVRQTGRRV